MNLQKYIKTLIAVCFIVFSAHASDTVKVYKLDIKEEIAPGIWRQMQSAFGEAEKWQADYILLHINTYGGLLESADSMRTLIINSHIPVLAFIDNNAASAGALISIACDSVYMRRGANIGAATVVDQSGAAVPDKYQSYMRSMMRSTAESHGQDTVVVNGDTLIKWRRDPRIAEAMVDGRIHVKGVNDSGMVVTFTTREAIKNGFCEGEAENVNEALQKAGITRYEIKEYKATQTDKMMGWLLSPMIQGVLIMLMIGGIYYELQSPGIGFPLIVAIGAAVLYFAPLYLEGLAAHWEIILFIVGVILIGIEIFTSITAGILAIVGGVLMLISLILGMVDNIVFDFEGVDTKPLNQAMLVVTVSFVASIVLSLYFAPKIFKSWVGRFTVVETEEDKESGYIGVDAKIAEVVGKKGTAATMLRPSGKVEIAGELYDAVALVGYIERGEAVNVVSFENGQIQVVKA